MRTQRDLGDLRRHTVIWIFAELWVLAGYLLQDPPPDPYEAAARNVFSWAMVVLLPGLSAVILAAWIVALRRRRRGPPAPRIR